MRLAPPASLDSCSALVNFSTRFRVSLGDKSPSSPYLRLEMSIGHMRYEVHFCKLGMLRSLLCQYFPKIHGRNSELSTRPIPNWLGVVSTTQNPSTEALRRDGPEPCCCLQEISVPPEDTRCFGILLIPEVRSKPHEQHPVCLRGSWNTSVRIPVLIVLEEH